MKKITLILVFTIAFTFLIIHASEPSFATQSTNELFVSAVNPQWNNYFAGPQVVEVIVKDPNIQNTNQILTEPTITVNGQKLRMVQATDGYWYAFFANRNSVEIADKTQYISSSVPSTGKGLDFGEFCSSTSAVNATDVDFSQTKGVTIAQSAHGASDGNIYNPANGLMNIVSTCSGPADGSLKNLSGGSILNHVVRHPPSLNMMSGVSGGKIGQIGINPNAWPIIQLFDFSNIPTSVSIVYPNTAVVNLIYGGNQNFPNSPNIVTQDVDRTSFPQQVFFEIANPALSIDPTDVDSWTWGTNPNNNVLYYQAFDENGKPDADGTIGMQNLSGNFTQLMGCSNCLGISMFTITEYNNDVHFQSNGLQILNSDGSTNSIPSSFQPMTMLETNSSSDFFINYDSVNKANVIQMDSNNPYLPIHPGFQNQRCGCTMIPPIYHVPIAYNNTYTIPEDSSSPIVLQGLSYDKYPITYSTITNPQHGTLTNINHNGSIIYLPNQDYTGNDAFLFKMSNKFYDSNIGSVSLTVNSTNFTPSAKVGIDQTVNAGSLVTLDGSASIDPYYNTIMKYYTNGQTQPIGSYLKYSWSQTSGIPVILSDKTSSNPTFVAPTTTNGIILPFTLTVNDKGISTSSPVTITVKPSLQIPPIQNATTPSTNNTVSEPTPQPSTTNITVSTDKSSYNRGDAITISSKISSFIPSQSITIRVLNEFQNPVYITSLPPAPDGSITTKLLATGPLWQTSGTYTILVQYNSTVKTLTAFYFNSGNGTSPANNVTSTQSTTIMSQQYSQTTPSSTAQSTTIITPTQQDIQNINQAKAGQTIAAEVNVGANQAQTTSIDNNVSVQTTSTTPDSLNVNVSAPSQTAPKVIMFNLPATTNVQNLKDLGVMYDGKLIQPAPNMDAILHAKSTDNPSFAIVVTQSGVQVLVLVPHFSTHSITIMNMSKVIPVVPEFGSLAGMIIIISIIGVLTISRKSRFHF